jgi:hypothetical protein
MSQWWEIAPSEPLKDLPSHRAVAYYRHSAQDRHYVAQLIMWRPLRNSSISAIGAVVDAT